jgi:hypothetical protein
MLYNVPARGAITWALDIRKENSMASIRTIVASAALASSAAAAQMPPPDAPGRVDVATLLNLDDARARKVDAILKAQREKMRAAMQAIRAETDQQLVTVLTVSELDKLRAAMPQPGMGRR